MTIVYYFGHVFGCWETQHYSSNGVLGIELILKAITDSFICNRVIEFLNIN